MSESKGIELIWAGKGAAEALDPPELWLDERHELASVAGDVQARLPLDDDGWRNLVVQGDNLVAMRALAPRHAGTIDLIYIDPPFATGLSYYSQARGGRRRAYRDDRSGGMAGYVDALHQRLLAMHELLAPDGKLFLHCDWRANSALRLVLDEVFGPECFRNEIVWRRAPNLGRQAASRQLGRVIDTIYVYSKTPGSAFAGPVPKRSAEVPLDRKGKPKGTKWDPDRELYFTTAPRGDYTDISVAKLREEGRIYDSSTGKVYIKYFLRRGEGGRWFKDQPVDTLWDDEAVRPLRHRPKSEEMGYDTQKPEGLLERIIGWATKPGDLVADFYSGSGTTAAVAAAMGRRFIACDVGETAVAITTRRVLDGGTASRLREPHDAAPRPIDRHSVERAEQRTFGDADALREAFARAHENAGRVIVRLDPEPANADAIEALCAGDEGRVDLLCWSWGDDDAAALRDAVQARHGVTLHMWTIPAEAARGVAPRKLQFHPRLEAALRVVHGGEGVFVEVRKLGAPGDEGVDALASWAVDFAGARPFAPGWRTSRGRDGSIVSCSEARPVEAGASIVVRMTSSFGQRVERRLEVSP